MSSEDPSALLNAGVLLDGKELWKSFSFTGHKVITGMRDGDKMYPFIFANTPLATSTTEYANNNAGHLQIDIYSVIQTEPRRYIPQKHQFTTNSASKKGTTISTTLGDPYTVADPGEGISVTRGPLLASFKFQVKSTLAMLSEKLMLPCWAHWWGQQRVQHGIRPSPIPSPLSPFLSPLLLSLLDLFLNDNCRTSACGLVRAVTFVWC